MKGQMTKKVLCLLLCISIVLNGFPLQAKADVVQGKESSIAWLQGACNENQEWENAGLPNLTCNVLALLRQEGVEVNDTFVTKWENQRDAKALNVDELAHLTWAKADEERLALLWEQQNEDGGFGLTSDYTSDVYDTLLVLQAELAVREASKYANELENATEENTEESVAQNFTQQQLQAIQYLLAQQREDGGYGYTKQSQTDVALTTEIGITLYKLGVEADAFYEKLDAYCLEQFKTDFSKDCFIEQAKLARYLFLREKVENPDVVKKELANILSEDGSVYSDMASTIQYILLLEDIEEYYRLKLNIKSMVTEANTYVLEVGEEQEISLNTTLSYTINQELSGVVRYTLLENETELHKQEVESKLQPTNAEQMTTTTMKVAPDAEHTYQLKVEWISVKVGGEVVWATETIDFNLHEKQEKEFILQAQANTGDDYGVDLSWTDISDEDNRYGYRVFRKKGDNEWETRSTWDGEEKVRVLNVYPSSWAKDCLINWMESTISASEEPAGKGLFLIDTVSFGAYNQAPDTYLLDEEGNYKYDVLMFGTADCNGGCDLSQLSYEATQAFIDSGRGVLFGHDTVVRNSSQQHPQLAKFAAQMGAELLWSGAGRYNSQVKVVNSGFLTSYPWKLSGTMNIPSAHTSGQAIYPDSGATIWMEFVCDDPIDATSGANVAPYLFSKNSVAMIQTGHSGGRATDDERKILANTLFYLKQLTSKTEASDKSFYDENAPEVTVVSEVNADNQVTIEAVDYGTTYQYYVEAINTNNEADNRKSNIVETEACSDIKGYVVGVSDTADTMPELLQYDEAGNLTSELIQATDGKTVYTVSDLEPGESAYLHIYAVDYAGNVSEEKVQMVTAPKIEKEYLNLPYTLFATEEIALSCNEAKINGDIYGADTIAFQGSTLQLDGKASTTGVLSLAGGNMELTEQEEGIEAIILPDYIEAIRADMENSEPLDELTSYNSTEITVPTICESTTGAWCQDVKIGASLLSKGSINLNANTISCGTEEPVVLCSETGDISIQTTTFSGNGLIYAPNGTVTINVCDFRYTGTIVAKKIKLQMTSCYMNQE